MDTQSPKVGQIERKTQNRLVALFRDHLHYDYLGNWEDREGNSNIEEDLLKNNLKARGYSDTLIDKAIFELTRVATNQIQSLYDLNQSIYSMLRYGVKVKEGVGEQTETVWLIDWNNPNANHFAIAEEVTIKGQKTKRPDIVIYVNGIAIGVIELKRSIVSVSEGIRQNIGNQKNEYIKNFFTTIQVLMAGNDTEGMRYGTIETPEEYYLTWKEKGLDDENRLDRHILQFCEKERLLEIIHDFEVFDSGSKKLARQNQYFGVKAAQDYVKRHEGGIIWHTQGSGKSLTMVWLAKWIRENISSSRVLILTDRTELDEQIEGVFIGVGENIYRTKNSKDLITKLNQEEKWLICSLIHKFGSREGANDQDVEQFIKEIKKNLPSDFKAKGDIFVFVDECHRTHGGKLHEAMLELLPKATFVGFTGTPLLSVDKHNSIATFGNFIHTYKYDEAVKDKVVLDLRYEARRVDQDITSQSKIDAWFEDRTSGLTDVAKAELKKRWGTMQTLLSSGSRLERVVFDILDDYYTKPRLASGRGNAMLVASSIYEACQYYDIFQNKGFKNCAIVTSYEAGALNTEDREYAIYQKMLDNFKNNFGAITKKSNETEIEAFERQIKELFIKQPAKMQLLIVVDKLLTGFDAPPATYLFIDKNMQDHGLFQAICRVNRLHGEDKEYGFIIDYRDLFKKLEKAVTDYTSEAFAAYDKEDVLGLLKDRLGQGKEDLEEALEQVRALCEPVSPPKTSADYIKYFCGDIENPYSLKENEFKRVKLYRMTAHMFRVFAEIANELTQAGFDESKANSIRLEIEHYSQVKTEIKLASGDYIDLKKYEPDMRMLIDRYITAHESEKISAFDDLSLVDMLASKGAEAVENLPDEMKKNKDAVAETIENNVRRLIIDEMPTNPRYFQRMSEILDQLVKDRRQETVEYQQYLQQIIDLTKQVKDPSKNGHYSENVNTRARQALYDNLDKNEDLALKVDAGMRNRPDDWIGNKIKERMVKINLRQILSDISDEEFDRIFALVKEQNEYR